MRFIVQFGLKNDSAKMSVYRVKTYNNRSFMKQLCTVVFNTGILPSDWQSFANRVAICCQYGGKVLPPYWQLSETLFCMIRTLCT